MQRLLEIKSLRAVATHFERSINLSYDAGNADYTAGYIPTPNGAKALAKILSNTAEDKNQRSHVLHAAYGSGKSLLTVVLCALVNPDPVTAPALKLVKARLHRAFPVEVDAIHTFQASGRRLLPVILSGDEGALNVALFRALFRALQQQGLGDLRPRTQFQAALDIIALWEQVYPEVYLRLDEKLIREEETLPDFINRLEALDPLALDLFERLYPSLTAGSQFDRYAGQSLPDAFHSTAKALSEVGYDGIIVIWDEFGRFIESKVGDAFGSEAALLQTFAEFCNRSGKYQVHLVLTTHRVLSGYAAELPSTYQHEWGRIAERFLAHNVASDPLVTYRLIAEAMIIPDAAGWEQFSRGYQETFKALTARSLELALFEDLDDTILRQHIERVWPLHPVTVYALPRLSNMVAQNERTLFTFLAADEPGTLTEYLTQPLYGWGTIGLDRVWDYFSESIRADTGKGGTHGIWSGVMYALSKVSVDDPQEMAEAVIKAMGVLLIVGEANLQTKGLLGRILPTSELIAWSLDLEPGKVAAWLETLARRRAVVFRRSEGYWTFTRGSDIDLEAEISLAAERHTLSALQVRQLLERDVPLSFHLPRSYNQARRMTRFFWSIYRWPNELKATISESFLKQLGPNGYADGAIVYVLVTNQAERKQALEVVPSLPAGRVVYVIPERPLLIIEPLRELFALYHLKNDANFMAQDERLVREVDFFVEDTRRRLARSVRPLNATNSLVAGWWWHNCVTWSEERVRSEGDVSRLLSHLCNIWFDKTPIINNELLNQQQPSSTQIGAAEKVIDVLLSYPEGEFPANLGLVGYGADFLIFRTLLVCTGLLQAVNLDGEDYGEGIWCLKIPDAGDSLAPVWTEVEPFLEAALENEKELTDLIDKLQSPPYGLRRGVLPVLLAAMLHPRLHVLTIRQNGRVISPLTSQVFTEFCRRPEQFTLEVGPWDDRRAILWEVLQEQFHSFVGVQEREQLPLNYLSLALLRWLQAQPRFCRDTNQISKEAQHLRTLIRKAQRDPGRVLLYDLLDLLEQDGQDLVDEEVYKSAIKNRLHGLMGEISTAYQSLLYQLDNFAESHFGTDVLVRERDGYTILNHWLGTVEQQSGQALDTFRFSDVLVQRLVTAIRANDEEGRFWDRLSFAMIGLYLHDWNDRSIETFERNLLDAKDRLVREIFQLTKSEEVVELNVMIPGEGEKTYRFRPSDLSPHGQRIFQNFVSVLEIAGRPLSPDEKRQVALALLHHVMDNHKSDDSKKSRK